ncbi:MAG: hypothetical protein R3233_09985, partial [Xanthomonadales bacterium]|nr:hypothetical protein [Xanthomonadales bacterium]
SRRILVGFREANVAVSSINEAGLERLDRLQALWSRQPEVIRRSGSTAVSVAHAMARLDALHDEFFVQPRRAAAPAAVAPAPATAAAGD